MKLNTKNQSLGILRSLLLLVLIIFGVWILDERGLVAIVMEGDRSQISKVIAGLWIVSSIYWLYLSKLFPMKEILLKIRNLIIASYWYQDFSFSTKK